MSQRYYILARRIQYELNELERTRNAIERHWLHSFSAGQDQDAFINSVALHLHSFYSGIERVLRMIADEFDGGVLGGENWHAELLRQMQFEVPSVRPRVLRPETVELLEEYRKFRHLIRNIYATNILPERLEKLIDTLPAVSDYVSADLMQFAHFLDRLAASLEES